MSKNIKWSEISMDVCRTVNDLRDALYEYEKIYNVCSNALRTIEEP